MALSEFRGQFSIGASSRDFGVGSNTFEVPSGSVYVCMQSGDATNGLCEHVETLINAVVGQTTTNVTYNNETGRVSIALNAAANLAWDDRDLGRALGYSEASYASGDLHTAERAPRHCWRPSRAMSKHPVAAAQVWAPRSSTVVGRSADGTTYAVTGTTTYAAELEFPLLAESEVITPAAGTAYGDFQQWFLDVIAAGGSVRFVPDRDVPDTYETALIGDEEDEEIGDLQDWIRRRQVDNNGLWTVRVPMMKVV